MPRLTRHGQWAARQVRQPEYALKPRHEHTALKEDSGHTEHRALRIRRNNGAELQKQMGGLGMVNRPLSMRKWPSYDA